MDQFETSLIGESYRPDLWKIIKKGMKMTKADCNYGFCGNCSYTFVNDLCPCRIESIQNQIKEFLEAVKN